MLLYFISELQTIFDRHPPQCNISCQSKHHPILVTLLNCSDEDPENVQKIKLQALNMVVRRYESVSLVFIHFLVFKLLIIRMAIFRLSVFLNHI